MNQSQFKICQFEMNLNYPMDYYPMAIEEYTNCLVNDKMFHFNKKFENTNAKYFIVDYKDDLNSLICYRMLKNLESVCQFDFEVLIYGKTWNTREYLPKGQKRISKWKLNKLMKMPDLCVIVQGTNLLYKVINSKITYNDFPCEVWRPISDFIPKQIQTLQIFYHIGYLKKDKMQFSDERVKDFNAFCVGEKLDYHYPDKPKYKRKTIGLVKIIGEQDKDIETLQQVEDFDGLLFYFTEGINPMDTVLKSEFSLFVKNRANIPDKYNVNNYEIIEELRSQITYCEFFGYWSDEERGRLR